MGVSMILSLIVMTFILGPAGGATYALANGLSASETIFAVSTIHLALVPVWFAIFHFLRYEVYYRSHIVRGLVGKVKITENLRNIVEKRFREFECRTKNWSFGIAVFGFTFLFGVSWAALIATLSKIRGTTIFLAIAVGAVTSSVFWTLALAGILGFLPSPWMLYLCGAAITIIMLGHGKIQERKLLRDLARSLKKLRINR